MHAGLDWEGLADFLRDARARNRLTQCGLAEAAGVSLRTVQNLESGQPHRQPPRLLPRLDHALGLPIGTTATILRDNDGAP